MNFVGNSDIIYLPKLSRILKFSNISNFQIIERSTTMMHKPTQASKPKPSTAQVSKTNSTRASSTSKPLSTKKTVSQTDKPLPEGTSGTKTSSEQSLQISKSKADDSSISFHSQETERVLREKNDQLSTKISTFQESERALKDKTDQLNKQIAKLKSDNKDLRLERDTLASDLKGKTVLLREAFAKIEENKNFSQKRVFLLKSRMLQQQKVISILTRNLKTFQTLYNEYWNQLSQIDAWLQQIKTNPSAGKELNIDKSIQSFRTKLEDLKVNCNYEYTQSIRTDSVQINLYEHLNDIYSDNRVLMNSKIKDRYEFEQNLVDIHEKICELQEMKSKNDKELNLLSFLSEKTQHLVEFLILEGFNPAKMSNMSTKKSPHFHIEQEFESMNNLISKVQHNRDAVKLFDNFEDIAKGVVGAGSKRNLETLVTRYISLADEDKSKKIFKNKEFLEFIDSLKAVDKTEKYFLESHVSILKAFLARMVLKLEDLESFYIGKLMDMKENIKMELIEPIEDLSIAFQNYQNENCNPNLSANLVSVFGVHHTKIKKGLNRLIGLGKGLGQDQMLDLKGLIAAFRDAFVKTVDEL